MNENNACLTQVPGFRAVGVACGLKKSGAPDLALIVADTPCQAAAVFTKNSFKAAPVLYDMALLERSRTLQAVVINAGNANAVTGQQGLHDAEQMARLAEEVCGLPADQAFVMSTGVIGHTLPMDKIEAGIRHAGQLLSTEAGRQGQYAAEAILTTDLVKKEVLVQKTINGQTVTLAGMAKGSGMIHPNMGTMLSVIVTDAVIEETALNAALQQAVNQSFNRVTVDGDTSTNDTVVVLASSQADNTQITIPADNNGQPIDYTAFVQTLTELCIDLAKAVARDGEGATKLVEVTVSGAESEAEAETIAKTVAISPLMKTALFGNDPNWGRALMAVGRSGIPVDPQKVSLWLGDFHLVEQGEPLPFDAIAAHDWLAANCEIPIKIALGLGASEATVWTCDFSYKYVEINAEYHT